MSALINRFRDINIIIISMLLIIFIVFIFWIKDTLATYYLYNRTTISIESRGNKTNQYLVKLLEDIPDAIIVRVNLIHSLKYDVKDRQTSILRWDTVYAKANPNYKLGTGPLLHDQPLVAWTDYMDDLIAGKCKYLITKNLSQDASQEHLTSIGIYAFDVCPIIDTDKKLLGAIFLSWAENNLSTNPEEKFPLIEEVAKKIAAALEESSL